MVKEILKYIPITTIIIIYLYVCGGLYLISFWSTFNLDISNIVGIVDIPKNFIYPFILTNTLFIAQLVLIAITQSKVFEVEKPFPVPWLIILNISMAVIISLIFFFFFYFNYSKFYWASSCLFLSIFANLKFEAASFIRRYFPNHILRYYVSNLIITLPLFCIVTAKLLSLSIYNNDEIKYVNIINANSKHTINDSTSFKLLGFLGDKLIESSLDNKKIIVLNQSSFEGVELIKKEDK